MNDENQENERPMILAAPASLTLPGFGFLIALNPIGALARKRGTQADHRVCRKNSEPFHSTKDNKSRALKWLAGSLYK